MFWFSPLKIQISKREITLCDLYVSAAHHLANVGKSFLVSSPVKNVGTHSPMIGRRLGKVPSSATQPQSQMTGQAAQRKPTPHSLPFRAFLLLRLFSILQSIFLSSNPISLCGFPLQSHPSALIYGTIFQAPPWQQRGFFWWTQLIGSTRFIQFGSGTPPCIPIPITLPLAHPSLSKLLLPGPTNLSSMNWTTWIGLYFRKINLASMYTAD